MRELILALNAGSSSLKAAAFGSSASLEKLAEASVDRIATRQASLSLALGGRLPERVAIAARTHEEAFRAILERLEQADLSTFIGIGHRVVHGGARYANPEVVTPSMVDTLRGLEPFDPEHLPAQISLIEVALKRFPNALHVGCFDTGFHHDLPPVARRLAIPRKFDEVGVRRYGFHGISYAYLMGELERYDPKMAKGRVVLAHLGNGASLAAVQGGRCIDTSMAMTPAAGIPMGTRSGDLDPGLVDYLARICSLTLDQINRMVHLESGLLGISETTSDMEELLELETSDSRAAEAVAIFCYQVSKWIGAYAAAMGGLDGLVFAGGIGEHAPEIRTRICAKLGFLGIALDEAKNKGNGPLISDGSVKVFMIPTDEEKMIAREVQVKLLDRAR